MFTPFLIFFAASVGEDLVSPFKLTNYNMIGAWTFGGYALVRKNDIVIAPPLQGHRGSAWNGIPMIGSTWSYDVVLEISQLNGGGSFGIWTTSDFGADGEICGGPRVFSGISILGKIVIDENNQHFADIYAFTNDGSDSINKLQNQEPFVTIPLVNETQLLTIRVSNNEGKISVFTKLNLENAWNGKAEISYKSESPLFLGITAMTLRYYSCISLFRVFFDQNNKYDEDKAIYTILSRNPHVNYENVGPLKNIRFNLTSNIVEEKKKKLNSSPVPDAKLETLLNEIDELNAAVYEVASFKDLNRFVKNNLVASINKWTKRSIKIALYTQLMNNTVSEVMFQNRKLFYRLNKSIEQASLKSKENLDEMNKLLNEASQIIDEDYNLFVREVANARIFKVFYGAAFIEIIVVIVLLIVMKCKSVKHFQSINSNT